MGACKGEREVTCLCSSLVLLGQKKVVMQKQASEQRDKLVSGLQSEMDSSHRWICHIHYTGNLVHSQSRVLCSCCHLLTHLHLLSCHQDLALHVEESFAKDTVPAILF